MTDTNTIIRGRNRKIKIIDDITEDNTKQSIFCEMTIKEFIKYIITFENIDEIINNCKSQSEKGFIFERLFDIIIKFGFCDIFPNSTFYHMLGNSNEGKLKIMKNLDKYLNQFVISGKSTGCSDITLQNKDDDTYIFISSKYPKSDEDKTKEKTIDYYDIQNIISIIDHNKDIYKKSQIYLVVPNKEKVLLKAQKADEASKHITKYITEQNILDYKNLQKYFVIFKNDIIKNIDEDWQSIYLTGKEKLQLRFHQELIVQKTYDLIKKGNKQFLWGCKCRSGKSYIVAGMILKEYQVKKKLNALLITPAPTETIPQFTDDLFDKFADFDKFSIHNIYKSELLEEIIIGESNIFVMSKQLLQKYVNENTIQKIKKLKLDIIIFDENHMTGTTDLTKQIFESYTTKNTVKIYLTATYNKPLREWNILPEQQMFWDLEDEKNCKSILEDEGNIEKLYEKHNEEYVLQIINKYMKQGKSIEDIFEPYTKMPELHIITNMFDSQKYEYLKQNLNNQNKMGFCFDTLLCINETKRNFCYKNEIKILLRYISGSQKEEDGEKTIFTRIFDICTKKDQRLPFTQIWFLPSNNINITSNLLKNLMQEDSVLKKYEIMCINRKNTDLAKNIKEDIEKQEIIAKSKGKQGVILLAGNMLSLGITLPLCDLVILMNNTLSQDKVLQQMYRCMTEGQNKKLGFVVDMNINRVLNTCINYTVSQQEESIYDKIKYIIKKRLINIDIDMLLNKTINSDIIIKKLMDIWKQDPINSFRTLLNKLDNDYANFDNATQKLLNKTFTKTMGKEHFNVAIALKDNDDDVQVLPTGITKVIEESETGVIEKEEIQISFTKDVLPYIIPLTCILTIKDSNMDFVKMLNDIKQNPSLLEIFDDQTDRWWNKKHLIDLIKNIVSEYFNKKSITYNISLQFKMSLQSLIDRPKELLELINECLKPKEVEKKEFGEVFTPMYLVNEMLDKLPKEVWTNKDLKWFDPAVGMGNFQVAIYLRLMESLKKIIKDDKQRKKHILENMLYISEISKKNVLICKQIFDINNEYKLNIYEGDSLELDINKVFGVEKFDIIIGNPPYNENNTGTGNIIWHLFVSKSINNLKENGYLCFVHPAIWRKPKSEKSKVGKYFKLMTHDNTILYLEIHNSKDGIKTFNCGTRYDFYVLKKERNNGYLTEIKDENNKKCKINLLLWEFLPNSNIKTIEKLVDFNNENRINIINNFNYSRLNKKIVSNKKTSVYKYELIYLTPKSGIRYMYSNTNDNGHFGISKVIIGETGIENAINDYEGKYGMTQDSFGIIINSEKEGEKILNFITSQKFIKLLKISCSWSNFRIDWRLFTYFKKDFYKEEIEMDI